MNWLGDVEDAVPYKNINAEQPNCRGWRPRQPVFNETNLTFPTNINTVQHSADIYFLRGANYA